MESVEEAVKYGHEKDARYGQEHQACVQRVEAREHLASRRDRRLHGTHSAEKHGRVEKRVSPRQMLEMNVAGDSGAQRAEDENARYANVFGEAP
jgi:hypothetical protein